MVPTYALVVSRLCVAEVCWQETDAAWLHPLLEQEHIANDSGARA
jgi:hypothetical protein